MAQPRRPLASLTLPGYTLVDSGGRRTAIEYFSPRVFGYSGSTLTGDPYIVVVANPS